MKRARPIRKLKKRLLLLAKRKLRKEILVLGDSHASIFFQKGIRRAFPKSFFNVINVGGATASGLANPNSKSQASSRFAEALEDTTAKRVIFLLGEVDAGFIIWYRAAKYGEPVEEVMAKAVETYTGFLSKVRSSMDEVICISAPLPTIRDGVAWGDVANARKEVTATQLERTGLTLRFNEAVRAICESHGIGFISLDRESLGSDGLVRPELLNSDPDDHHYEPRAYSEMLLKPLMEKIGNRPSEP